MSNVAKVYQKVKILKYDASASVLAKGWEWFESLSHKNVEQYENQGQGKGFLH